MNIIKIDIKQAITLYEDGYTQNEIAIKMGVGQQAISRAFSRNGYRARGTGNKRRKYIINENFFKKWSPNMAYILGFLAADGNVHNNSIRFKIHRNDIEILEFIRANIGMVSLRDDVKQNQAVIGFYSEEMAKSLLKLGITPNKTYSLVMKHIPKIYVRDFVRGVFDGDGSITVHPSGGLHFGICGAFENSPINFMICVK